MNFFYRIFAVTIIGLYFILGIITLSNYGINWDEVNHLTRGQAYLYFFLTRKEHYGDELFKEGTRHSFYQIPAYDFTMQKKIDGDHPVLSDIMSSLFNWVFYQKLGIVGDFDAYHLYGVALTTFFLIFLYFWVEKNYGGFASLISLLALTLYPLFYGESHFNAQKDIPETIFYGLAAMAFYTAYTFKSAKWMFFSALFFGAALGTKFNIAFLPFTLILWLMIKERASLIKKVLRLPYKTRLILFLYPLIGFSVFFFSWPHMWYDSVKNLLQVLGYYRELGTEPIQTMSSYYYILGFNTYAPQWILFTTPLITLALSLIGIFWTVRFGLREKNKTSFFILFWFLIPIVRVMAPSTSIYGGVRQIMEYIPPMAILAGIGAGYLVKFWGIRGSRGIRGLIMTIILLSFIPITLKIISIHPNESIYFNELIGGLRGAQEKNIPGWGNSLGSTYRQGVRWINENTQENAKLALKFENRSNIPLTLLRKDIKYHNTYRSGPKREGEYVMGVTHYNTREEVYHDRYLERFLIPVYEVKVDGVAVLKIWKNDIVHTKPEFLNEDKKIENISIKEKGEEGIIVVKFPHKARLTKVVIEYDEENCTVPWNGRVLISENGEIWTRMPGNILQFTGLPWFQSNMERGKLQYLFAAEEVQYMRFSVNTKESCLIKNPIKVTAWEI